MLRQARDGRNTWNSRDYGDGLHKNGVAHDQNPVSPVQGDLEGIASPKLMCRKARLSVSAAERRNRGLDDLLLSSASHKIQPLLGVIGGWSIYMYKKGKLDVDRSCSFVRSMYC
jgi:hypothetical protein